jgi:hypothetical protein
MGIEGTYGGMLSIGPIGRLYTKPIWPGVWCKSQQISHWL